MALIPRVWLIPSGDSEFVECAFGRVLGREPPSLTSLAARVIAKSISYPSKCRRFVSQLPAWLVDDVRRHALRDMINRRSIKLDWSELGYSIRLAIIYNLMDRSGDFPYTIEFQPRIWGALELGENMTPLIEIMDELVMELISITRTAQGATMEWFVGIDKKEDHNSTWQEVRFFLKLRPVKKNVQIRTRLWELTEYNPCCGQIKIEMDPHGRMNSFAVKDTEGFKSLVINTDSPIANDDKLSQMSAVLKNIWLTDRKGQRGCAIELI